ncbi:hypothetical protein PM082_010734 [Marasmius tenuissimus]|nr:hypothetical protein PM082_010734 [Marasmius tenuissimus]
MRGQDVNLYDEETHPSQDQPNRASDRDDDRDLSGERLLERTMNANALTRKLFTWGVETRGIHPVPGHKRTDAQYHRMFFLCFGGNLNILTFSAGALGPLAFDFGVKRSCLVITFFTLLCSVPPAYLATWGPKLGLRQIVQARYSFGYYGVIVQCILNLVGMLGFCILNCIVGGQTLASVADGHLSFTVGIVIIGIISFMVSFCGYDVINRYERLAWFPVLIVYLVAVGVGGKNLYDVPPAEPLQIIPVTFDRMRRVEGYSFTRYLDCRFQSLLFNAWPPLSLLLRRPYLPGHLIPERLAISYWGCSALISFNVQVFIPKLAVVPRYVFSVVATAIVLPLSIAGAHKFYDTLTNLLSLLGYGACAYIAVVVVEHIVFRHRNFSSYDLSAWNTPNQLPTGLAALGAGILSFGLVIPCMDQIWFMRPIAQKGTGDLGFEAALVVTGLLYVPFRAMEKRIRGI